MVLFLSIGIIVPALMVYTVLKTWRTRLKPWFGYMPTQPKPKANHFVYNNRNHTTAIFVRFGKFDN